MHATETITSVYRYYDEHGALIYVGITQQGANRNEQHATGAAWWPFVVRQSVEHVGSRVEALARERELILRYRPPFNRQHNLDHAELRAAYLAFRAAEASDAESLSPGQLFSLMGKRMPLHRVWTGARGLLMRSRAEHRTLASALRMPEDGTKVPVYGRGRVGAVKEVSQHGPFAVLHIAGPALPESSWAVALVRSTSGARPIFYPKAVFLNRDPNGRLPAGVAS